ncbi:MAG: hypothetical protein WD851_08895 [Pirellulales bacterium]
MRRTTQIRRGSVLLLVLIVAAMLALAATSFFRLMFREHKAARTTARAVQTRALAESGVVMAKYMLLLEPDLQMQYGGIVNNPSGMQGVLVLDSDVAALRGRFTILAPAQENGIYQGIRFGMENESARLNLNTLLLADEMQEGASRNILMGLPGMTPMIADAILDWIDADDETREFGAERDYYSTLASPYQPQNGPLACIEQLLLVRDMTPELLYGADHNRNYVVDSDEQGFTQMSDVDNSDGSMNRGWDAYFTLFSAERNTRDDGSAKIDVNMENLQELHNQLSAVMDADQANFIVAYRQGGPYTADPAAAAAAGEAAPTTPKAAGALNLNFEDPGAVALANILDLIGSQTRVVEKGQTERTVVETPFRSDPGAMRGYLPILMENITVNAGATIPGRLSINQAPRGLLLGVPGMPPEVVDAIVANRDFEVLPERPDRKYETWILTEGYVELAQMRTLMPFLTGAGDVYRAQVAGYFEAEGPTERLEVVIDNTTGTPQVVDLRELKALGPGFSVQTLGADLAEL